VLIAAIAAVGVATVAGQILPPSPGDLVTVAVDGLGQTEARIINGRECQPIRPRQRTNPSTSRQEESP
jgi:hypothetical protein